jgi:hypothetical protein
MIMLRLFIYFIIILSLIISHGYVLQCCLNKDQFFIILTSYIRLCPVYMFYQFPNDVRITDG